MQMLKGMEGGCETLIARTDCVSTDKEGEEGLMVFEEIVESRA